MTDKAKRVLGCFVVEFCMKLKLFGPIVNTAQVLF